MEKERYYTFIAYLSFLFFVPLLINRKSEFVKLHVNNGLTLFLFNLVAMAGLYFSSLGFKAQNSAIIQTMSVFTLTIFSFFYLLTVALAFYYIYISIIGKKKALPLIGNLNLIK